MSKKIYFGSNFKMYKDIKATRAYLEAFTKATKSIEEDNVQFFFIPSFTSLESASTCEERKHFMLGAQNMSFEDEGQFTGEISPLMLKELNIDLVMLGHSERRHVLGESDSTIHKKVLKALEHDFNVLLCVGETLMQKEASISEETLRMQLKIALKDVESSACEKLWIAYEPVWSIGVNGIPASADYAQSMHHTIRKCLIESFGDRAKAIPILYGGSVNPENAVSLIVQSDIDGLFTTRTAFDVESFSKLISESIKAKTQRY